ncbi:hypothetical protein Golomagni_05793 [Golovinomyces magnicellulatus]|nr:hypothetical protein Golomagni_05793 [Golovinomyces magnicellulatus]
MLTGINCTGHIHLVVGTDSVATVRCESSIAAGAIPVLVADGTSPLHPGLQRQIKAGFIEWERKPLDIDDLQTLGREEVAHVVDAVFITSEQNRLQVQHIFESCKRNRIPINVADAPHLSTFTLLSTYTDGSVQVGVTTNTQYCKLSSRILREISSILPNNLGVASTLLGRASKTTSIQNAQWLAQVAEYWPLKQIASLNQLGIDRLLLSSDRSLDTMFKLSRAPATKLGKIILAGSGPGHPDLLTQATLKAMQRADLVLADKLIPVDILDLIPHDTPVSIARKFPGNAHAAQQELEDACIAGAFAGKTVLRLKQGDPFLYGRGGEEVDRFRQAGLGDRVSVLPGLTSALSAPLLAGIPTTQRGVADQVLICTGMGQKGNSPTLPEFVASRTTIFLMALHRIQDLVKELTTHQTKNGLQRHEAQNRSLWPIETPCAVIERASCPDQRVIRTTLEYVVEAMETEGSRPPGLLVIGTTCSLDCIQKDNSRWYVEEGLGELGSF